MRDKIKIKAAPQGAPAYAIILEGVEVATAATFREVEAFHLALLTATWYSEAQDSKVTVIHPYKGLKVEGRDTIIRLEQSLLSPLEAGESVWAIEVMDWEPDDAEEAFFEYLIGEKAREAFERYAAHLDYSLHRVTLVR